MMARGRARLGWDGGGMICSDRWAVSPASPGAGSEDGCWASAVPAVAVWSAASERSTSWGGDPLARHPDRGWRQPQGPALTGLLTRHPAPPPRSWLRPARLQLSRLRLVPPQDRRLRLV